MTSTLCKGVSYIEVAVMIPRGEYMESILHGLTDFLTLSIKNTFNKGLHRKPFVLSKADMVFR
jgi:hypothetical protein